MIAPDTSAGQNYRSLGLPVPGSGREPGGREHCGCAGAGPQANSGGEVGRK